MKPSLKMIFPSLFAALMVTGSCNKDESQAFTDTPIVEAYLTPGNYLKVKISRQVPFLSDVKYTNDDIDKLLIAVNYNDSQHLLTAIDSGWYIDSSILVKESDIFNLSFTFNSKEVSAYTYIPSKPENVTQSAVKVYVPRMDSASGPPTGTMSDPVEISWSNEDESYYLVVVENIETTLDPIFDFDDDDRPGNRFRKSPTNSAFESIRPMDFQYFGTHRIIVYHVLPDYAALYDQNSTSSMNLTNPSTSISNGYGIFTGMSSDTLYIEVKESSR
ncbi:MAG: hypothetical protein IPF68_03165 [Bacteroidales bacterium]|nr:hypothetical protein [Bacteroidales bacterium]